jgi:hypothetical protein
MIRLSGSFSGPDDKFKVEEKEECKCKIKKAKCKIAVENWIFSIQRDRHRVIFVSNFEFFSLNFEFHSTPLKPSRDIE